MLKNKIESKTEIEVRWSSITIVIWLLKNSLKTILLKQEEHGKDYEIMK